MKYYSAFTHNIIKALGPVDYPVTKKQLHETVGNSVIQTDFDNTIILSELLDKLPLEEYSCAHELFNNVNCALVPSK